MLRVCTAMGFCLALLPCLAQQGSSMPTRRAALILNSAYQKLSPLTTPHLDGAALEDALRKTNFDVVKFEDNLLSLDQFEANFVNGIKPGDIVLVFYSGYALQSGNDNFLLPINFNPDPGAHMVNSAFSLVRIQEDVEDAKALFSIFLIDAAYAGKQVDSVSSGPGLIAPQLTGAEECFLLSSPLNQSVAPTHSAGSVGTAVATLITQPGSELNKTMLSVASGLGNSHIFSNGVIQSFFFTAPIPVALEPAKVITATAPPVDLATQRPQTNKQDREDYRFISKEERFRWAVSPALYATPPKSPGMRSISRTISGSVLPMSLSTPINASKRLLNNRSGVRIRIGRSFIQ